MNNPQEEQVLQKIELFADEFELWLENKLTNHHSQTDVYSTACAMSNKLFYDGFVKDFPYVRSSIMDNILDVSVLFETGFKDQTLRFRKNMFEVAVINNETIKVFGKNYKLVKV